MSEERISKKIPTVAGLDIGTTKVVLVLAEMTENGIEIIGKGEALHTGVKQGSIINIEEVSAAIRKSKEEVEMMSGRQLDSVWVSVSGQHIQSFDSHGMAPIKNSEVKKEDVDRVIEVASTIAIPSDRQVLHVIPKEYKIDQQEGILDPLGMTGVRLEADVHMVTGCAATLRNTKKCVERSGLRLKGMVLQQLASAEAVLSDDEKKLGVALVDLGGGTCDLISYDKGNVKHVSVIPVGGQNFIQDISLGLKTTQKNAFDLLKKHGNVLEETVNADETLEVDSIGGNPSRTIQKLELSKIIGARAEETIELIKKVIVEEQMVPFLGSGVVFTGGLSQLEGFIEMCDYLLDVPVRKGIPIGFGGMRDIVSGPSYATVMGLIKYGSKGISVSKKSHLSEDFLSNEANRWKKFKDFFTDVF